MRFILRDTCKHAFAKDTIPCLAATPFPLPLQSKFAFVLLLFCMPIEHLHNNTPKKRYRQTTITGRLIVSSFSFSGDNHIYILLSCRPSCKNRNTLAPTARVRIPSYLTSSKTLKKYFQHGENRLQIHQGTASQGLA